MPTVIAADEALSSCSQKAAYSATIIAAQVRSAKAQAQSGKPAMVTVRRFARASWLRAHEIGTVGYGVV